MNQLKYLADSGYLQDPKMVELAKHPRKFCDHFEIPYVEVKGIAAVGAGRSVSFEYLGKQHKRVELVAKAFYETQGYEVSWSEGVSIILARAAINGAIGRRLADSFELCSFDECHPQLQDEFSAELFGDRAARSYELQKAEFEKKSTETYQMIRGVLYNNAASIRRDEERSEKQKILDEVNKTSSIIRMVQDPADFDKKINSVWEEIKIAPPLEEFAEHIDNAIAAHNARYSAANLKYQTINYNEWVAKYSMRLIEVMGVESIKKQPFETEIDSETMMKSFDLTLLDPLNKTLKFAEVKNNDGFTAMQVAALQRWIKLPEEARPPFELCFVCVEK